MFSFYLGLQESSSCRALEVNYLAVAAVALASLQLSNPPLGNDVSYIFHGFSEDGA